MKDFLSRIARECVPYQAGEQPLGKKFIKLNTNENPYPPAPKALEAYKNFDFSQLNRYPSFEAPALRAAIAAAEGVDASNIFCGNGSDEILALAFRAFFDEDGQGAAFADVTYSFYKVYAAFFNVPAHIVPLEEDFTLDLKKLTAASAQGLIVANPNAPTGIGIPLAEIEPFVAENSGRVVILDEAYMPYFKQSAARLVKKYKNLVVVKTFSKGYSLAGIRCGYAVADEALVEGLERCRDCFNSYPVDRVCQAVCTAAIADDAYYARTEALVRGERERLTEEFTRRGFTVLPSVTNFIFAKHPAMGGEALYKALYARGILVRNFKGPRTGDFCRITVGTHEENDGLLAAVDDILKN